MTYDEFFKHCGGRHAVTIKCLQSGTYRGKQIKSGAEILVSTTVAHAYCKLDAGSRWEVSDTELPKNEVKAINEHLKKEALREEEGAKVNVKNRKLK
jgi:predicted RecA/RadA family phage recombinase